MRLTSHLPGGTKPTTRRRQTENNNEDNSDDDDHENSSQNRNSTTTNNSNKRQKQLPSSKQQTTNRRTTTSTSATMNNNSNSHQTPLKKTTSRQAPVMTPQTPFQSPGAILRRQDIPKTPAEIHQMLTSREDQVTRPVYETEALQITELCAFKVDHTAYNSYLYTGKMKVPIFSNIAREDYASSVGASVGKNIKVHQKPPTTRAKLSFNLDGMGCDDDDDDHHHHNNKPLSEAGKRIANRRATTYATQTQVTPSGAANVCLTGESSTTTRVQTRGSRRDTGTPLQQSADWEFSFIESENDDVDSDDDGDEYDDGFDDHDDDVDEDDDDQSKRSDFSELDDASDVSLMTESDVDNEQVTVSKNTKTNTTKITTSSKAKPLTKKQQLQLEKEQEKQRREMKNTTNHYHSDEEVQLAPTKPGRQTKQITTTAKPLTKAVRMQPNPPIPCTEVDDDVDESSSSSSSSSSTPPEQLYQIVNIVVKYPLMGSLDDWKDSFQTCQEEVVMYRQIQTWKCPFLLRYYGTHGPGLVFEYVDGESLDSLLFHASDVDIEAQTWLWSELGFHTSSALLYLHKLNISHNDIKPENVRYSATKRCWKLLDLGLATDFDMKVSRQIGTDGYRSPEVASTGRLNRRSDVYSLGVMMDDALERIVARYQVLEDIHDEWTEILQQHQEELKSKVYRQKGGQIDLDQTMQDVLTSYIKRRKMDSIPINLENSRYVMEQGSRYVLSLENARDALKKMLAEDPEDRLSVVHCLAFFKSMIPVENELRDCLAVLRSMGIF